MNWVEDRDSKKPMSVSDKDIYVHIYRLIHISLMFYDSGFGCETPSRRVCKVSSDLMKRKIVV